MSLRWKDGESYWHLYPLVLWRYRSIDYSYDYAARKSEKIYTSSLLSPFFSRFTAGRGEKQWDQEPYRVTMWAPLVPIGFYYHREPERSHLNILTILDMSWKRSDGKDQWNRFWLMPLVFKKFGEGGYLHVLPFFISWNSAVSVYDAAAQSMVNEYRSHVVSPVYYLSARSRGEKKWDAAPYYETRWFGFFLPLYYKHADEKGTHKNLLWMADWSRDSTGELKRFWLLPFWFDRYGASGYRHILPPLYLSAWDKSGEQFRHVLPPLYLSWRSMRSEYNYSTKSSDTVYSDSLYTLLYSRFTKHRGERKWDEEPYQTRVWWGPIIPLYYSFSNERGAHRNIMGIVDWKVDMIGAYERFWVMPFFFRKWGEGGYLHAFPFYMRPSGWTAERGYSFGLFHYNSWTPEKNVTWAWIYYNRENPKDGTYYSHLLPFYLSWKNSQSFFRYSIIGVPWQFQWEDGKRSLKFNLLGFSKSAAMNPLTPGVVPGRGPDQGPLVPGRTWNGFSWLYEW